MREVRTKNEQRRTNPFAHAYSCAWAFCRWRTRARASFPVHSGLSGTRAFEAVHFCHWPKQLRSDLGGTIHSLPPRNSSRNSQRPRVEARLIRTPEQEAAQEAARQAGAAVHGGRSAGVAAARRLAAQADLCDLLPVYRVGDRRRGPDAGCLPEAVPQPGQLRRGAGQLSDVDHDAGAQPAGGPLPADAAGAGHGLAGRELSQATTAARRWPTGWPTRIPRRNRTPRGWS